MAMTQHAQQAAASRVGALVAEAVDFYHAGKLEEAEQRCAAVLEAEENNVRILALFGTLHAIRGSCEEAIRLIGRSLSLEPRQPFALNTMGNALRALKRHQEAVAAYEKAIALKPTLAAAYCNLGRSLIDLNRAEEAIGNFDKAIALEPDSAEAFMGKGNALRWLRRFEQALPNYDQALQINPDFAEAHVNRGGTLVALNRFSEAGESYDKAIALKPDPDTYKQAGDLCSTLFRFTAAIAFYENAIALRPGYAAAHYRRAYALRSSKRYDEALESVEKAIELDPKIPFASGERLTIKMGMCHWKGLSENIKDTFSAIESGFNATLPFPILGAHSSPALQRKCAELNSAGLRVAAAPIRPVEARAPERLRIAYVSADFHMHPVARHIVGLIEAHDPARFETVGVCLTGEAASDLRVRLKGAFDRFVLVDRMSDDEAATMLREMDIHIAVDLTTFTRCGRPALFARRIAPIQVNYLGYPGTTGASFMDYIIGDATVTPMDEQPAFSEKIVHMPHSYLPNGRSQIVAETSREAHGLPETGFVFCSLNNSFKITAEVFDVWMRLLAAVENSVLWLTHANAAMVRNLDAEAAARGIDPRRLLYATQVPKSEDHMGRLRMADLFLDTVPYNAHSSACEALWAGLPVLTCMGQSFPGRVAASVLKAVGLPEMVTRSLAEYEARALELARDPAAHAALKEKLSRNRKTQPLFNIVRYTRNLEAAYLRMWELHRSDRPPVAFAVDDVNAAC
jgi:predicted O-linked N-acetylglucosamine transferase (SPINDLY family)